MVTTPDIVEDRLSPILDAIRPGLAMLGFPAYVVDTGQRYWFVNASYEAHFKRSAVDVVGRTVEEIYGPPPADGRREPLFRALAGETLTFDRQDLDGGSAEPWSRVHYMPLRADGAIVGIVVLLVNIQHLKDSEEAMAARERQLALITDTVGFPVTYIDRGGILRFANAHSGSWAGLTPREMIGRPYAEMAPPEVLAQSRPLLERAFAGESVTYEREAMWPGREDRRVRGHMIPDRDEAGTVRGVLVVLMDITEDHRLQESLLERTRELQLVTENVGVPMAYIGADRRFRFANTPGMDWLPGITPDNIVGKSLEEVFSPAILAALSEPVERAQAGEKVVYERQGLAPDGTRRWVRVNLIPDKVAGRIHGVFTVVIDIDEDKRLRDALERQERQLRFYAENIPEAIAFVGRDMRYEFVNKTFERIVGKRAADIIGHTVPEVLGKDAAAEYFAPSIEGVRRGEPFSYERLAGPAGADRRWIQVRIEPHMDADGAFGGYYVVGTDIHDVKLAQERLAEQEAKLRLFTDNIPVAVAYLDTQRRYVFVNRSFAETRGKSLEQIIGHTSAEVLGEEAAAQLEPTVRRVMSGRTATFERELVLPSGERRWILGRSVPDIGPDGAVRGMYVVGHDVQDLKMAQAELRAREEELRFFAENIPEAIVYIDLERGCTFVNNVFLATHGLTREFAIGKFPKDVYPPELVKALQPYIDRATTGESVVYERRQRPTGETEKRWARVKLTPRKDGGGNVLGFYVVSTDIHELKAAQVSIEEKERELRQVIDSIPTPMVYVDAQHHYRYVNDAFLGYVGRSVDEVIGHTVFELLGSKRSEDLAPLLRRVEAGERVSFERLLDFADGRSRWMNVDFTPRHDARGHYLGYYAATSDIHGQKLVEEELRLANSVLSAHFDNTPLAVIEWDPTRKVVRWSGNAPAIFGFGPNEVLGRSMESLRFVFEEDADAVGTVVRRLLDGSEPRATMLNRNYRKDGSVIWVEWHHSALHDADGHLVSILSLAQDVSSRIQAEERLQFMATHDGLTGLPNRLLLPDRLSAALSRAQRFGHGVAVLFLDLDHFKDVNDTLGHRVGDELLKDLSRRIRGSLRQTDFLVRLSGDEFVVVLEDLEGEGGPDRVAQKILDDVMRPFPIEGHEVQVSASLGYAVYPEDGEEPELLLKNADAAMYHAKELGRNSFRAFSRSLAQRRDQRLGLEAALRRAIRRGEFELHYQPILDVATGRVCHAEALVRWHDPERGLVLPSTFIPVAEEAGLMRDLGHWITGTAARQSAAWHAAGIGTFTVCVNLSASQLRDSTIVPEMEALLAETGCAPTWLTLEITETSMVRDVEGVSLTLLKLRRMGFRIAIDDFGTGFSSLSHLRHLPVDTLKIDKSFVADIDDGTRRSTESGGAAIVAAVTGLAHGLGLDVVAEGVEKASQLAFLREHGCTLYQGYLACPPLPAAEFEQWLAKGAGQAAVKKSAPKKAVPAKPAPKRPAAKKPRTARQ